MIMKDRVKKPRVFLSHSKKDISFIQRLCDDLRRCQVEPWLDEYEIRHGQPWLDAIFEDGMPACDAVIAYVTRNSITSAVVRKEIDVGILRKLSDSHIAFLPYVRQSALRSELRADLQALQTTEWNDDNYSEILPRVVAEVWRSFLERTVVDAVQRERLGRVEAELRLAEIEKRDMASAFSQGESRDFEYIWSQFARYEPVTFRHAKGKRESQIEIDRYTFYVQVGSLLPRLSDASNYEYGEKDVYHLIRDALAAQIPGKADLPEDEAVELAFYPDLADELLMYGFVTRFHKGTRQIGGSRSSLPGFMWDRPYALMYTEKIERFKYWLAVEGRVPNEIRWKTDQTPAGDVIKAPPEE
jgi:hypothetical protein